MLWTAILNGWIYQSRRYALFVQRFLAHSIRCGITTSKMKAAPEEVIRPRTEIQCLGSMIAGQAWLRTVAQLSQMWSIWQKSTILAPKDVRQPASCR